MWVGSAEELNLTCFFSSCAVVRRNPRERNIDGANRRHMQGMKRHIGSTSERREGKRGGDGGCGDDCRSTSDFVDAVATRLGKKMAATGRGGVELCGRVRGRSVGGCCLRRWRGDARSG